MASTYLRLSRCLTQCQRRYHQIATRQAAKSYSSQFSRTFWITENGGASDTGSVAGIGGRMPENALLAVRVWLRYRSGTSQVLFSTYMGVTAPLGPNVVSEYLQRRATGNWQGRNESPELDTLEAASKDDWPPLDTVLSLSRVIRRSDTR